METGKAEQFDVVIVGGGHNGTTTAAYLAKCGLSVCVLEDRPECDGSGYIAANRVAEDMGVKKWWKPQRRWKNT